MTTNDAGTIRSASGSRWHRQGLGFKPWVHGLEFNPSNIVMHAQVPYDLLVGADGVGSIVKSAVRQIMPSGYLRRYRHKQVYSMATVTPSDPEDLPPHTVFQIHALKAVGSPSVTAAEQCIIICCHACKILIGCGPT